MPDIECFLHEKLKPLYEAHYAVWVHWWPWWRKLYSGRGILEKWREVALVQEGQNFLDYGCGTGCFAIPAAKIVSTTGRVYALDCFPRQLEIVKERARKEGLINIETILSDNDTGLPDASIDVVWMCDVLHEIKERRTVLEELHRILRDNGTLAIYDGMKERVLDYTTDLFSLIGTDDKLFRFNKRG